MEENVNKLPEDQEDPKDGVQESSELVEKEEETTSQSSTEKVEKEGVESAVEKELDVPTVETTEQNDSVEDQAPLVENEVADQLDEAVEEPQVASSPAEEATSTAQDDSSEDHEDDDHEEDDEDIKLLDSLHFDSPTKQELYTALKKVSHMQNMRALDKALKEIKPHFDQICDQLRSTALKNFLEEPGNDEADFVFKGEEIDEEFNLLFENLRLKKQKYFSDLEKEKDENLRRKNEVLEKLRELVDGEESTASFNDLKTLQQEFRKIGPVPGSQAKSMWANYNAIIDRFYDNRSIYFELKELDRRKNLEGKLELCEKAEKLNELENIKDAIIQLNELHEEFKHIGPIPKDDQEPVWQRFKAASDQVYAKRKEYFDQLKTELTANAEKKQQLGNEAAQIAEFNSDRITDWNKKTKELIGLQKKWEEIGGLPREKAKEINKHFWSNFKQFFSNKNAFFKTLEGQREENLKKKQELLEKAVAIQDNEDWDKTANELKKLQTQWREIGPVPEKFRNEVYAKFKAACDHFFEKKRARGSAQNKEYEQNLKKKEEICDKLEAYMNADTIELEDVYTMLDSYAEVGFVPRNAIKTIHNRFDEVTDKLLSLEDLSEGQRSELHTQVQLSKLKNSPHGSQKINRKEGVIKRKISALESDIANFKRNMEFFANSKTADKFKADIEDKIAKAEKEIKDLRSQLKLLNQI